MKHAAHPAALVLIAAGAMISAPSMAFAQRADDNAVADAEDAFGSNDGGEDLGLYGPFDVRGFSPIDAGNVRIDGVYVDRQADLSPRLVEGNRIRVGPSAVGYAFPAPSGVVDYRLRTPGDAARLSTVNQVNSFGGALFEVDMAMPVIEGQLSVGAGFSLSHSEYASGNNADINNMAAIAHWRPAPDSDAKLFWSRARLVDEDIYPIVVGDGNATPPRIVRRRFLGQHWADVETERFNTGFIGRTRIAGFGMRLGILRSTNEVREGHSVFLQAAPIGQAAPRSVSAYPGRENTSTSGELAIARDISLPSLTQHVQLIARARSQERLYGGTVRLVLPPAPFGHPSYVDRLTFPFGGQTSDRVQQWSVGLAYQGSYDGWAQLSAGIQRVSYRKTVEGPNGPRPASRDDPWLINVAGSVTVTPSLSLFGSFTQGLEESDVAPEIAVNRDEAPPAIRTRQVDGSVRLRVGPFTAILGAFDIERPYFGVDVGNVFRRLGSVRHAGVEASLTGSPLPGLTIIAGGNLLRARLSGDDVASGLIGNRPVDVPAHKLIVSADWRPASSATSLDFAIEHVGPNVGDALNRVRVAPYTTVDLGLRHRLTIGGVPAVLRLQATNLLNAYGWEVAGNNAFIYIQPRQLIARLAIDF